MKFPFLVHRRYNTTTLPDIGRVNLALFMREFDFKYVNNLGQSILTGFPEVDATTKARILDAARIAASRAIEDALLLAYRPK